MATQPFSRLLAALSFALVAVLLVGFSVDFASAASAKVNFDGTWNSGNSAPIGVSSDETMAVGVDMVKPQMGAKIILDNNFRDRIRLQISGEESYIGLNMNCAADSTATKCDTYGGSNDYLAGITNAAASVFTKPAIRWASMAKTKLYVGFTTKATKQVYACKMRFRISRWGGTATNAADDPTAFFAVYAKKDATAPTDAPALDDAAAAAPHYSSIVQGLTEPADTAGPAYEMCA
eukprot:tig00000227_g19820.t1